MSNLDGDLQQVEVPLGKDRFMRSLIRELAGTLEDVIGLDDARGYISVVGGRIGDAIDHSYRNALQVDKLDRSQVAAVMVDLKRRIEGEFFIVAEGEDSIVLGNRKCPFGDQVLGHPSMCMMTSNVFGRIAASNLGYAKVELQQTIADGYGGCRVVVHLRPTEAAMAAEGREYFPETGAGEQDDGAPPSGAG